MSDPPWLGRDTATHSRSGLVVHGLDTWEEWIQDCGLGSVKCVALFDHNDVVNTLSREEAIVTGFELDHLSGANGNMPCLLCSYGKFHAHKPFLPTNPYLPFVEQLDGYVFTDVRSFTGNEVTVYREDHLPIDAIRITGDKACVSRLLNIPTVLFDDKEDAIAAHRMGHPQNQGFVVKRGRKRCHHYRTSDFDYAADPRMWVELVREFGLQHGAIRPVLPGCASLRASTQSQINPSGFTLQSNLS